MLRDKKFLVAIIISLLLLVWIGSSRPHVVDWSPSFSSDEKIPYGTYILYQSLSDLFPKAEVETNKRPLYYFLRNKHFSNTSLVFIGGSFKPSVKDKNELLNFVAEGNNVFISAGDIGRGLADALKITQKQAYLQQFFSDNNSSSALGESNFTNTTLHCDSNYKFNKDFYSGYYKVNDHVFDNTALADKDTVKEIVVLGVDGDNEPTFIRVQYGKGYVYLHTNPYSFTNYYLLKPRGTEYISKCLSYLPQNGKIIVDEGSRAHDIEVEAPLSFILSREALRLAYMVTVGLLLLYVLFNFKRRQKIIPVIEPYKNASLDFAETIGGLYYDRGDHKDMAQKRISYFMEFLRNRYNMDTSVLDAAFVSRLNLKSGIETGAIEFLLRLIKNTEAKKQISSTELIDLNRVIDHFKNNCQ